MKLRCHHLQAQRRSAIPATIKMVTRSVDSFVLNNATLFRRKWAIRCNVKGKQKNINLRDESVPGKENVHL